MTACVLVVDDIPANVKLLEARLTAEYFEVLTANSGREALEICSQQRADVILLDVMMPEMDGFETCRRLKAHPQMGHVPVIMVTALDQPSDKVQGLEAGADDFLTKPVDDVALITRVKNLARLKLLTDELMMRAATSERLGIGDDEKETWFTNAKNANILLVEDHERSAARIEEILNSEQNVSVQASPEQAIFSLAEEEFDLLVVSLSLENADGLRLCSQVRSLDRTRHMPILVLAEPGEDARLLRGLDMGVNDYLVRPIDRQELLARVRTQIKRKRYADYLKFRLEERVEAAITDSLTGLYNRRYMESHLKTLVSDSIQQGAALSVLLADIDFFKSVNDQYGHDAGDLVLKEFSARLRKNTRGIDLSCRIGGEEFVVIMPNTNMGQAYQVAERLRQRIEELPFGLGSERGSLKITASIGLSTIENIDDSPEILLKRADQALYGAKRRGRNRVVADAA